MDLKEIIYAPDISTVKQKFTTESDIARYLEKIRWPEVVSSPFDIRSKVYTCKNNRFRCKNTGKYFNVKTNTLFHNSKIPLTLWFQAIWLVANTTSISSVALGKELNLTQKSAWYMLKRIKAYLKDQKIRPVSKKLSKSVSPTSATAVEQPTMSTSKLPITEWLNFLKAKS